MSFRCGHCNEVRPSGEKPIRRVVAIREKSYVGGGHGWEIAKELLVGEPCAPFVKSVAPEKVRS